MTRAVRSDVFFVQRDIAILQFDLAVLNIFRQKRFGSAVEPLQMAQKFVAFFCPINPLAGLLTLDECAEIGVPVLLTRHCACH